ncbi:hypothetical protein CRM22_010573 [Opisthorchis felineus]|uniref:Protein tweety homolog n=1 Tax=Opisthorchis felineus TaxID=147828 RepID=A0A4S2KWY6_OPIFE|nr:hypothetical protein CRM22_010573 [Opisthorchis felineus]
MAGSLIAENFEKFAAIFSPSLTGGVMNLVFQPTTIPEVNGTVLTLNDINMDKIIPYVKSLMLTTKQEHPVFDVLPPEVKPDEVKDSTYIIQLILLGVAFVLTLGLWIGTLVIPCIFCCSKKKRDSEGSSSKGCLIAMGVITGVLLIFLVLCLPLVYVSISSLVAGIDGKANEGGNSGLKNTVHVVVAEASLFLKDIPTRGRKVTTDLLVYLQTDLTKSLSKLVKDIKKELLVRYNVRTLINEATTLSNDVNRLQEVIDHVKNAKTEAVNGTKQLKDKMDPLQQTLQSDVKQLCNRLQASPLSAQCNNLLAQIDKVKFDFDDAQITVSDDLLRVISTFGSNLTIVLDKLANLETKLDEQIEGTISQIENSFNLTQQLQPMLQLWDNLGTEVSDPVIQQLNQMEPTVDEALTTAAKFTKMGGFIVLVLFTIVLVIILVFGIIASIQAARDSHGPRCCLCCGLILPVVFCFLIPLLVLICGVIVLLSGIITNEGCRYVGNPSGVVVTDGTLNLYLRYLWPQLMSEKFVDPSISLMLDIPVPKNVLDGILIQCKSSETTDPGLLPSLGVDHFLNATAMTDQPDLKKAVKEAEEALVTKIREFDFASVLPDNLNEINKLIEDLKRVLGNTTYEPAIKELEKVLEYSKGVNTLLDQLEGFVKDIPEPESVENIKTTINRMRQALQEAAGLNNKIMELINAFKALQGTTQLLQSIQKFSKTLEDVVTHYSYKVERCYCDRKEVCKLQLYAAPAAKVHRRFAAFGWLLKDCS